MNVFTYGTLLFPEVREALLGRKIETLPAKLPDFARYQVQERESANTPAIVYESGSAVHGEILLYLTEDDLKILDCFEDLDDGDYEKREVEVECKDESKHSAYVYVAGPSFRELLSGDWNPIEFRNNQLKFFLDNVLVKYL